MYPGRSVKVLLSQQLSRQHDSIMFQIPTNTLLKPPITEYNIYHNITNGLLIKDTVTNNNIVFNDSVCGEYYTISVSAKNIIGNGNNVSINSKL